MAFTVAGYFHVAKVYRIAVFGGKSVGKTSLLAALGMNDRPAHPLHFASFRQNSLPELPEAVRPKGDPDGWVPADLRRDPRMAFVRANRWVDQAEDRLRTGRQPRGNEAAEPPLLLVYQFTDPGHGVSTVEVVEFAGELLNPQNSATDNRAVLDGFLRTVDGLLILAEAPHPDRPGAALGRDLQLLQQALGAWNDGRRVGTRTPVPVGLVFSKWDRRGGPDAAPDRRAREVEELLSASPAHQRLWDAVTGITTRTARFAVSAYGRHEADHAGDGGPVPNTDRPVAGPRPAFGLEDPFVWACRESDRAVDAAMTAGSERVHWLTFWRVRSTLRTRSAARDLLARSAAGGEARDRATRVCGRSGRAAAVHAAAWVVLLGATGVTLGLGIEGSVDARERAAVRAALDDPGTTDEQFASAVSWLDGYTRSGRILPRVSEVWFPVEEARHLRAAAVMNREDRAWTQAGAATEPGARARLLDGYLKRFPAGTHAEEARRELAEAIARRENREQGERTRQATARERDSRRAAVAGVRGRFAAAQEKRAEVPLREVQAEFFQLPPPLSGVEAEEDLRCRAALESEIGAALVAVTRDARLKTDSEQWTRLKQEIDRAVENLDFKAAATKLRHAPPPLPGVDAARKAFGAAVVNAAGRKVREGVERRHWDDPLAKLEAALIDTDVVALTDEKDRARLRDLARDLKRAKDRAFYDDFKTTPTRAGAKTYLESAPLKTMKPSVDAFLKWEADRAVPQPLTVEVQIEWGEWADDKPAEVEVWVTGPAPGDVWRRVTVEPVRSRKGGTSEWLPSGEFPFKPTDPLKVWVVVERTEGTFVFSDKLKGGHRMADPKTPEDLVPGTSAALDMTAGSDRGAKTSIRVKGVPPRPPVGDWAEKE